MSAFRYQAVETNGAAVSGLIEAEDRRSALRLLSERGLFPSSLEAAASAEAGDGPGARPVVTGETDSIGWGRVRRKEITSFTREMASLLRAGIPIPQALDGLAEQEVNAALRSVVSDLADSVRRGAALSAALEAHPRLFGRLYASMVRVGEEGGVLPKVMNDLASLLEHDDEVRGDVLAAVAYPCFVLGFGVFTVIILLSVVLPRLFGMLSEMMAVLPWPTRWLLETSAFLRGHGWWLAPAVAAILFGLRWHARSPEGGRLWDACKLRLPVLGGLLQAAALSRFARTLGTLLQSGVSLLPALKIVEDTIGNRVLAGLVSQVAEETRGGDSLAAPLRKLGIFPRTIVQMIHVGEETGKLDEMLLQVAAIEERHMRSRTKTLVSLLAPGLILVVGTLVGFMVIALLLPIFKMSQALH